MASIDESIDPCEDFYGFACNGWIKNHPIPATAISWNQFNALNEKLDMRLKKILSEGIKKEDEDMVKATKMIYRACMDEGEPPTTASPPSPPPRNLPDQHDLVHYRENREEGRPTVTGLDRRAQRLAVDISFDGRSELAGNCDTRQQEGGDIASAGRRRRCQSPRHVTKRHHRT